MQKRYEAPSLTVIGKADYVVMGASSGGTEAGMFGAPDFEFEPDCPLN